MTRCASCAAGGRRFAAVIDGDEVRPLAGHGPITPATITQTLAAAAGEERLSIDEVEFLPVVSGSSMRALKATFAF